MALIFSAGVDWGLSLGLGPSAICHKSRAVFGVDPFRPHF
jgi:hypothetical protein